jgi:hypothetical protein
MSSSISARAAGAWSSPRPGGAPHRLQVARLELLWADGRYAGELDTWSAQETGFLLQIVCRPAD